MDELELTIKRLIVDVLNLEDIEPEEIVSSEMLFVEGLGLDSIDALELGMAIQKSFDVKIDAKTEEVEKHFQSVSNLAAFISSKMKSA